MMFVPHVFLYLPRALALALLATSLGCSSSGGDSDSGAGVVSIEPLAAPNDEGGSGTGEVVPGLPGTSGGSGANGTGLRVDFSRRCPIVGETFDLTVAAIPAEDLLLPNPDTTDVTSRVTLGSFYGDTLELISRTDDALALRMNDADMIGLRLDLQTDATVTVYIAGFPADAASEVMLRKPVPGGCLYALRLPSIGFCGTTFSREGLTGRIGSSGRMAELRGCEYTPIDGVPAIDYPATTGS